MKNPKEVEVGKRLAEWNRKNKEKLAQEAKAQKSESETNLDNLLWRWSCCSHWGVRCYQLLHLPIQDSLGESC